MLSLAPADWRDPGEWPGAGDLFTAGFLYGMLRGYPLQQAARVGCLAGGAVVQSLGAELSKDNWRWLFSRRALVHSCLHAECNVVTAVHVYVRTCTLPLLSCSDQSAGLRLPLLHELLPNLSNVSHHLYAMLNPYHLSWLERCYSIAQISFSILSTALILNYIRVWHIVQSCSVKDGYCPAPSG